MLILLRLAVCSVIMLFTSSLLYAANIDCEKVKPKIEVEILGDDILSELNEELARVCSLAIEKLGNETINKEQHRWVEEKLDVCEGDPDCVVTAYMNRLRELYQIAGLAKEEKRRFLPGRQAQWMAEFIPLYEKYREEFNFNYCLALSKKEFIVIEKGYRLLHIKLDAVSDDDKVRLLDFNPEIVSEFKMRGGTRYYLISGGHMLYGEGSSGYSILKVSDDVGNTGYQYYSLIWQADNLGCAGYDNGCGTAYNKVGWLGKDGKRIEKEYPAEDERKDISVHKINLKSSVPSIVFKVEVDNQTPYNVRFVLDKDGRFVFDKIIQPAEGEGPDPIYRKKLDKKADKKASS